MASALSKTTAFDITDPARGGPAAHAGIDMAADMSMIDVQILSGLEDAEPMWQSLEVDGIGGPYQTFRWCKAWCDTIGTRDRAEPVIVIGTIAQRPVFILPLVKRRRFAVTMLSFLGSEVANQNTGLWLPQAYAAVPPGALGALLQKACDEAGADVMFLENLPESWAGRAHPLVQARSQPSPSSVFQRALDRPFDQLFVQTHSKSTRRKLKRKRKLLGEAGGFRAFKATTQDEVRLGLDAFLHQRKVRAVTSGIPSGFSDKAKQAFLADLSRIDAAATHPSASLDIWILEAGGAIQATYLSVTYRGTLTGYATSVGNTELTAHSPAIILINHIVEAACADPEVEVFDFGLGDERYKRSWTSPVTLRDAFLPATLKGRAAVAALQLRQTVKASIRGSETIWSLVRKARKWRASTKRAGRAD
ncbi:MAG: GNAT family N-acetyltransferase [Roseibium sp.]|nr:GNAT family N-acetyltransferase [Roseibium sp.]